MTGGAFAFQEFVDTANANPLTVGEMQLVVCMYNAAHSGIPGASNIAGTQSIFPDGLPAETKMAAANIRAAGLLEDAGGGRLRLTDTPINRAAIAVLDTFPEEPEKSCSALTRMMGLNKALNWPELDDHIGYMPSGLKISCAVMQAAAVCRLTKDFFGKVDFLTLVESFTSEGAA